MEDFVKENDYLERLAGKTFSFNKASRSQYHVKYPLKQFERANWTEEEQHSSYVI